MKDLTRTDLRRRFTAGCAVVLALLAVVLLAPPASAHSTLVRSDPPDGGTVAVGRSELSLWFGEPIDSSSSSFRVLTDTGEVLPVTVSMPAGQVGEFVQLETPRLQRGILRLEWRAVSAEDGHSSAGTLTFGAGVRPPAVAGSAGPPPPATEVVLRWVQLVTLMLAIGGLLASRLLRRSQGAVPAATHQALRLGSIATLAAFLSTLVTPLVATQGTSDPLGGLSGSRWGQLWLLQVAALLVATAVLSALIRRRSGRLLTVTAGCALAVAATADAAAGHSAELTRQPVIAVAAATVHVLAAGAWIGTLAVLAACLLPAMRQDPELRRPLLLSTWRAFSPVAAMSVALVAATGLYLAGRQLPALSTVSTTWYGLALAGKVVLLLSTLVVAASTTLLVNPRLAESVRGRRPLLIDVPEETRFPRLIGIELALLGGAVVLASVLTSVPRPSAAVASASAPVSVTVDGLFVTFESVPSGGSASRLIVRTNAVTRPQPGPVTGVDVLLERAGRSPVSATLSRIEPGRFEANVESVPPDEVKVWLAVHRPAAEDAVAGLTWSPAPRVDGGTHLEQVTTPLAALGLIGTAVALVLWRRRRSRTPDASWPAAPRASSSPETVSVGAEGSQSDET